MIAGRVIMLSRDRGLASIAGESFGDGQPVLRYSSPAEVPDWLRPPTGVVVLDYPRQARAIVYRQLRQRYLGPVLALLDPDEKTSGLPVDHGRIGILHRPFTGEDLSASLETLAGLRNGARRPKSRSLTAQPLRENAGGTPRIDVSAVFAGTPAALRARRGATGLEITTPAAVRAALATPPTIRSAAPRAAVGVPATRHAASRVEVAPPRRGLTWRRGGPAARRRVNSLALSLAAAAALAAGATLSDGGCRSTACDNVARANENGALGIPLLSPDTATSQPGLQPLAGSSKGPDTPGTADPPPGPSMIIPIASGVDDLISGTSSSSGGAPVLVAAPGPSGGAPAGGGSGGSGGGGGGGTGGGGTGGGVPTTTTQPTGTTSPVTTAPPTTGPPTTPPPTTPPSTQPPPTTEPPSTSPPTTEPPATQPPTTAPPTTEPPTTAGTSAT